MLWGAESEEKTFHFLSLRPRTNVIDLYYSNGISLFDLKRLKRALAQLN